MNDLDRSIERLVDSEAHRGRTTGFGTTKQGQGLARQYLPQLADRIAAARALGRDKDLWKALRGFDDDALALRLLVAGISVAESSTLGTDAAGEKDFLHTALWIGSNLGHIRKLGLKVGAWGVDMLLSLPIFALDDGDILKLTAAADDIMDDVLERGVKNNPLLSPLVTPPDDWTQVNSGGLPPDHWATVPFIREHHRSIENAARKAIGTGRMRPVLDAVNALQQVPFAINVTILDFINRDVGDKEPALFDTDIATAEAMACADRFWVPLNIDFRGRIYGIPHFNFAREDHVRALFLFANGERIGEDGLRWLKAYVATTASGNAWSPEEKPGKSAFAERVAWTDANIEVLRRVGESILRGDDPATIAWALPPKSSDRYQFAAACAELVQVLDAGPDFITRLPLTFDASCSGLQHLCAMTRADEGRFVNLVANDEQDDFYTRVAHRVWTATPELIADNPFDREIVKQPAMSYFYGSRPGGFAKSKDGRWRPYGMTEQVVDVLKERKQPTDGAKDLARAIYAAIEDMVPKAKAVRDLLETLAGLCADAGIPLRWETLLGLPVINCYHEPEIERVSVSLRGRRRRVNLVVGDKPDIDKDKAANAATANFVHSMDAAHLQFVALAAAKEGIDLATVHDCFGCTAPRAARLNEIIREQFVHLYEHHNVLGAVWSATRKALPKDVEMPLPPKPGNLEIKAVIGSDHAFK